MSKELQEAITTLEGRLNDLRRYLDLDRKREEIAQLEKQTLEPNFWDDQRHVQHIYDEINQRKRWVERWDTIHAELEDAGVLYELAVEEHADHVFADVEQQLKLITGHLDALEFETMLDDPDDVKNAILTINPGAGGTESQDWSEMLMRMYLRWAEQHNYKTAFLDYQSGEEAGIKSVTIEVSGEYAYGYLKSEIGVHRLVRVSPFNAQGKRQTSFAAVFVYPEVDDNIEIDIREEDLRIDTYRASGAGGQHVNKTSSAVRITHLPTNIVVQCQSERSQHMNRDNAMKMLRARLYQLEREKREAEKAKLEESKTEIGWGNQIRSYVFHPYSLVKDHRTNVETSNTQAVMDGDIDLFINAWLKQK
ncbi:MAG: peptide chain release factor 2 [Gemmatimonadetes bacterium]|nr:MAG: peptide chain release factor 2 [Gemmatimonadota bacterium]